MFKGQQNNGTRHHGLQVNWKTFAAGINSHKARICSLGILPSGVAYSGFISARKKAVALALGQHTNSEAVPRAACTVPLSSAFRHEDLPSHECLSHAAKHARHEQHEFVQRNMQQQVAKHTQHAQHEFVNTCV